jgi:D-alanyl-D-alanine endopeptidase (penicillin-binding protein 7)
MRHLVLVAAALGALTLAAVPAEARRRPSATEADSANADRPGKSARAVPQPDDTDADADTDTDASPEPVVAAATGSPPDIKSPSAVVLDAETGAELFSKAADEVRPIASTTKIFVAMAVRKKGIDLDAWTEITKGDAALAKGGARTRLDVGAQFKNRDLLAAMLIASDNRAPAALGRAVGWSPEELVHAMNGVAKELHLRRTRFTDPSGLHGNVSTAREMALGLRKALEDDVLRQIMGNDGQEVVAKGGKRHISYWTTNQALVAHRFDVIGGKTGYTKPAGYCFVTAAKIGERPLLFAFYGADSKSTRFADFYRVAAWVERGAPGAKVQAKRAPRPRPSLKSGR